MLSFEEAGLAAEERFYEIMTSFASVAPEWYVNTKRAKPVWDDRGIDFFVYIRPKGGGKRIKVPVQIKAGNGAHEHFQKYQSRFRRNNILVLVVSKTKRDQEIWYETFSRLARVRRRGRRFTDFYNAQIKEPLPEKTMARRRLHWWVRRAVEEHMARIN